MTTSARNGKHSRSIVLGKEMLLKCYFTSTETVVETTRDRSPGRPPRPFTQLLKINVFRLHLNESREGFCRRGRGRSFYVEGPKTEVPEPLPPTLLRFEVSKPHLQSLSTLSPCRPLFPVLPNCPCCIAELNTGICPVYQTNRKVGR